MKITKFIALLVGICFCMVSCKDDDGSPTLTFEKTGFYFQWGGDTQQARYTSKNVASLTQVSITEGWKGEINHINHVITLTPPQEPTTEEERAKMKEGTMVINAVSADGTTAQYRLSLYIIGDKIISLDNDGSSPASCFVATQPSSVYSFNASIKGNSGEKIAPYNIKILWQTKSNFIKHLTFSDSGLVTFFIEKQTNEDGEDVLEDGKNIVTEANALLGAVDKNDNILWSWHIWAIRESENPFTTAVEYSNGKTFMTKNLGSFGNHNGKGEDTDKVLSSYGLYYQWGRKDPFLRPRTFDCAGGESESIYGSTDYSALYFSTYQTDAEIGTIEYATKHPHHFIINPKCIEEGGDGIGDWCNVANNSLWSDNSKSINDPCPAGWKVPSMADLSILYLSTEEDNTDLDSARSRYGWSLTDGVNNYFYAGCGYRTYFNGKLSNMNYSEVYPSTPEPWEGYYWTTTTSNDGKAKCLYFDLTTTRTINKFQVGYPTRRANGLQVRCVKM